MPTTQDIVQKLWNLCHVLRDDGVTYHEYVTELTFLLFLKMAKETGVEDQLPMLKRVALGACRLFSPRSRSSSEYATCWNPEAHGGTRHRPGLIDSLD